VAGKSRVTAGDQQRDALLTLAHSRDRGEADRARAILLTLSGWTSPRIAEACAKTRCVFGAASSRAAVSRR
jgi:hypothetical protein